MAFIGNRFLLQSAFLAIALGFSMTAPAWPEDRPQRPLSSSFSPWKGGLHLQLRIAEVKRKSEARSYYKSVARQQKFRSVGSPVSRWIRQSPNPSPAPSR